jgi:carboxymethylenebutenolidase
VTQVDTPAEVTRTDIAIGSGDDQRPAVLVRPASGDGPWPAVVMLHEAWGVNEVLLRQADRLAGRGYLVLVPDLYGEGNRLRCMINVFRSMKAEHGQPFRVIETARQRLLADEDCTGRAGVIGFCMGGGFALLLAQRGFDASSVNYGSLPEDLDAALVGACPIVASYGMQDGRLRGSARRLGDALQRAEIDHDVKEYPKAGHSFLNDSDEAPPKVFGPLLKVGGAGPEPESAADAWRRIERFFDRYLR